MFDVSSVSNVSSIFNVSSVSNISSILEVVLTETTKHDFTELRANK